MTLIRRTPMYGSMIGKHEGGKRIRAQNTTIDFSAWISAVATVLRLHPSFKLLLAYSRDPIMAM